MFVGYDDYAVRAWDVFKVTYIIYYAGATAKLRWPYREIEPYKEFGPYREFESLGLIGSSL